MTIIEEYPTTMMIDHCWSINMKVFRFHSDVLAQWVEIPVGFTCDWESVPLFKGTSKVAGFIHDYLSRYDSVPKVTKKVAADVYMEFMKYRGTPFFKRWIKYSIVLVWPGYFHKKSVNWKFGDSNDC
jgi:hypothetical protein